jgi:pyruvate formate lyase activating enzyme
MQVSAIQKFTTLDFPGKSACIIFTAGCNFRCGYCHNPEFVLPDRLRELREHFIPMDAVWSFLKMRRTLLDGVVISGGEPTLHRGLEDTLIRIKSMGFETKLDTNGSLPEMLKPLLEKGLVDYVAMDIKTSLSRYAELVSACVRPDAIQKSIEMIRDLAPDYEFRTTIVREHHDAKTIEDMRELVRGVKRYALQGFRPGHTLDESFGAYASVEHDELDALADVFRPEINEVIIRT